MTQSATPPTTDREPPVQRRAVAADLPRMWDIRTAAMRVTCAGHYAPDVLATMLAAAPPPSMPSLIDAGGAFVAEVGGTPIGYAILDTATGEVDALFVEPAWQGRGIARRLLAALEATALDSGVARMFLSSSLNAVACYESAGFRTIRQEIHPHRSGIGVPAVLMEKHPARDAARND